MLKVLCRNPKPYLDTLEIFTRIAPIIANNVRQTPMCRPVKYTGDMGGGFVFIRTDAASSMACADYGPPEYTEPVSVESPPPETTRPPIQRPMPSPQKRYPPITNSLGMKFVYIPPGEFLMGSPPEEPGRYEDEIQHRVRLTQGFFMQTTEVTQGQWRALMGKNPSGFKNCGKNCPVENVRWKDVQAFIQKLNKSVGKPVYRLPTEAEWEYACRAGSTSALANGPLSELACGHDPNLDKIGWYCGNAKGKTHSVRLKAPNGWGLYDMHGNVWEWCEDWYGGYLTGAVDNPVGPLKGSYRVMRGGGWGNGAVRCRSAGRRNVNPGYRSTYVGFRLSRSLP
jgi:formylglycine-generating enzyme required for sulfatase activity